MENNLYQAPQSELNPTEVETEFDLASRGSRLGASLLDTVVMMVILLPLMYALGWFELLAQGEQPPFMYSLIMGLAGFVIFILINIKLLMNHGQTIGKRMVGIKIVDMDGNKPLLTNHLLKRYLTYFIPNQIPLFGSLFGFVNILFIFRKDKRCIHDLAGGTQVVRG